jgi:hypothetical protein
VPHEICLGEWPDAPPAMLLCDVRSANWSRLPARDRDAPHLLRSRLLRGSLQMRRPASRKSGESIMTPSRPNRPAFGQNRRMTAVKPTKIAIYLTSSKIISRPTVRFFSAKGSAPSISTWSSSRAGRARSFRRRVRVPASQCCSTG